MYFLCMICTAAEEMDDTAVSSDRGKRVKYPLSLIRDETQGTRVCSLVPRLSPQKQGGEESLVTSAEKAVDFRRVIIHVIYNRHSHFSAICHVI